MAACAVSLPVDITRHRPSGFSWADEADAPTASCSASASSSCHLVAVKINWADMSDSETPPAASSAEAPKPRWADLDDSPADAADADWAPVLAPAGSEDSCRERQQVDDCSTCASSVVAAEEIQEDLLRDVDGDEAHEETVQTDPATSAAMSETSAWPVASPSSEAWDAEQAAEWWHYAAPAQQGWASSSWQQQPRRRGGNKYAYASDGAGYWSSQHGSWSKSFSGSSSWKGGAAKSAKGGGKGSSTRHANSSTYTRGTGKKYQCQFTVGIEEEPNFKVVRKVLGPHGQFVKKIAETTGAKLRLRGKGSGFLEGPSQVESSDPLMLCVSVQDAHGYGAAKRQVSELLEDVYRQYTAYCQAEGMRSPKLRVDLHEGPREGSY
eukprot:TRINITY_DN10474_c0_g1_i3.p1 TRINITY_DN10474_c0_g1~~TRINITY_DN10474_c0_g1_i3.p1  ORF type:complete len:405 (+),score=61.55 TRINITY_DN10474_c0_g1_i3:73-1215(+)